MKKIISTPDAPKAAGPYSQAVSANGTLYISAQIPINPHDGTIATGIEAQTEQVLDNICAILQAAGMKTTDVVKTTVMLADMADFATVNEIYGRYFTDDLPARSCFAALQLPKGVKVAMDAIAAE